MLDTELRAYREQLKVDGQAIFQLEAPGDRLHSYPYDAPWLTDPAFNAIHNTMRGNTLVDRSRCWGLYTLAEQTRDVPGDILEVGVWRGGTTALLAQAAPERHVFAADTFTGVVKASADHDRYYKGGEHADTSRQLVEDLLGSIGISNVTILEGVFPEDTGLRFLDLPLSLVHLDIDVHDSTADAFEAVWPNVSQSGIVAFDDYGFRSACSGVTKFVDGIRNDKDKIFIPNINGHAYIIKK